MNKKIFLLVFISIICFTHFISFHETKASDKNLVTGDIVNVSGKYMSYDETDNTLTLINDHGGIIYKIREAKNAPQISKFSIANVKVEIESNVGNKIFKCKFIDYIDATGKINEQINEPIAERSSRKIDISKNKSKINKCKKQVEKLEKTIEDYKQKSRSDKSEISDLTNQLRHQKRETDRIIRDFEIKIVNQKKNFEKNKNKEVQMAISDLKSKLQKIESKSHTDKMKIELLETKLKKAKNIEIEDKRKINELELEMSKIKDKIKKIELTKNNGEIEETKKTKKVKMSNDEGISFGASIAKDKGNHRKGKYLFRKNCHTCHKKGGVAKELGPSSKTMANWEKAFKKTTISTYKCKDEFAKLKKSDINNILTYLHDFAADSPNPLKFGDSIRKAKMASRKAKKKRQISNHKKESEKEIEQEINSAKGKTILIDDKKELAKAAEKISNNYINASMKLGKSLPELGPIKAKKIFETAFSETGYNYNKTLHEFAEKLSDNPMMFLINMDEQISKILMAFTLPYEEAKTQHIDINQLYKGQALEDIEKIKEIFESLQKGSNN